MIESSYWVLWIALTVSPGHIAHIPVTGEDTERYATQAACEEGLPELLVELKNAWPDDEAIDVTCELFTPGEPQKDAPEKRYPTIEPPPEVSGVPDPEEPEQPEEKSTYPRWPIDPSHTGGTI